MASRLLGGKLLRELSYRGVGREAAVLVPLSEERRILNIYFIVRSRNLRRHPGEIAFPGGVREECDTTPVSTALREAWEEVGLMPHCVRILGFLRPVQTLVTGFELYPVVGEVFCTPRPVSPEVEEVFVAEAWDLASLLRRDYFGYYFNYRGRLIWGATARIVVDLLKLMGYIS